MRKRFHCTMRTLALAMLSAFATPFVDDNVARAQLAVPTWNLSTASNVLGGAAKPSTASKTYSAGASVAAMPTPATSVAANDAPAVTPQVTELARALKYNPDLIYEYVRDNVQTLAEYGSMKGPLGPILDGNGTVFDQAELMEQLLQASESSNSAIANPQIAVGQVTVSGAQLTSWLGTSSATSMETILNAGGFPATYSVSGDTMNSATIEWAWVTVQISGTTYAFDPSTKSYAATYPGLAQNSALIQQGGYSQSKLLSDLTAGSSSCPYTNTGSQMACLSPGFSTFTGDIQNYGLTIASYMAANAATISPQMAVGGQILAPLAIGTQLRQSSLPNQTGTITSYTILPTDYRVAFGIQLPGSTSFPTWNLSDLYGHRLTVSFSSDGTSVSLILGFANSNLGTVSGNETTLGSTPTGSGTNATLGFATFIHHPYGVTPSNQVYAATVSDGSADVYVQTGVQTSGGYLVGVYDLVVGVGPTGRGMVQKHTLDLSAVEQAMPDQTNSEPVLGESLAVLGYTWLAERSQAQQVLAGASNTAMLVQQELGVVGVKGLTSSIIGPYLDIPTNTVSAIQLSSRGAVGGNPTQKETGAFFTDALMASSIEGAVISQTQPNVPAVSTAHLFALEALTGSSPLNFVDANNNSVANDTCAYWGSTLRSKLVGYQAADLTAVDGIVGYNAPQNSCTGSGNRALLTAYGAFLDNGWSGAGYLNINQTGTVIQSLITGNLSGGISGSNVTNTQLESNTPKSTYPDSQSTTAAQVGTAEGGGSAVQPGSGSADLVTGSFTYSHTDLSVGSGSYPYALSFTRSYDSASRLINNGFGNGWSTNLQVTASLISDPFEGLGTTSAEAAAPALAYIYAAQDIMTPTGSATVPTMLQIVAAASAIDVFMTNLNVDKDLVVSKAGSIEHFIALGNGTFAPPPGSSDTVSYNGTSYAITDKHKNVTQFDAAGNMTTWTSPAGPVVTVSYQTYPYVGEMPQTIKNNMGRELSFNYTGAGVLESATDGSTVNGGNPRKVSYVYANDGVLSSLIDPTGATSTFTYDSTLHLTGITTPSSAGSAGTVTSTIGYDNLDRYKTFTDPLSRVTSYYFAGSRTEIDDPLGDATITYLNPFGLDIADVDAVGNVTQSTYDALDRLVTATRPDKNYSTLAYDSFNNVISVTDVPKPELARLS